MFFVPFTAKLYSKGSRHFLLAQLRHFQRSRSFPLFSLTRSPFHHHHAFREDFVFDGVANRRVSLNISWGKDAISLLLGLASRSISLAVLGIEDIAEKELGVAKTGEVDGM